MTRPNKILTDKQFHVMDKKTTHDVKTTLQCAQTENIKEMREHMASMQTGFGRIVEDLHAEIQRQNKMFMEVLLPSDLHPNNGLINKVDHQGGVIKDMVNTFGEFRGTVNNLTSTVESLRVAISALDKNQDEMNDFIVESRTAMSVKDKYRTRLQWIVTTLVGVIGVLLTIIITKI